MKGQGKITNLKSIVLSDPHYESDVWCRYDKKFNNIEDWKVKFIIKDYEDIVNINGNKEKFSGIEYSLLLKKANSKCDLLDIGKISYERACELKEYELGVDTAQIAFGVNEKADEINNFAKEINSSDIGAMLENYNPEFAISTASDGKFGTIKEGIKDNEIQFILIDGFFDNYAEIETISELKDYLEEQFKIEDIELEKEKLKILYKEVGKRPKVMEIDDTLEAKQELVGGLIEVVPYKDNMLLICNEEGKIYDLPANLKFDNDYIAGNCFVVGDDYKNAGFKSLTTDEIRQARVDLNSKAIVYPKIDYLDKNNDMEVE